MYIFNLIANEVENIGLEIDDFSDVCNYLLEKGVIVREDTEYETKLYDIYIKTADLIESYFSIIRVQVYHDDKTFTVRLFSPMSKTPNNIYGDDIPNNFSYKLNSEETAYLISLAILYDQKIRTNMILDDTSVEVDLEEFTASLATNIGFTPTDNKNERKEALKSLKKFRVVHFSNNVFENADNPLIVRPQIKDLVLDSMIAPYIDQIEDNEDEN